MKRFLTMFLVAMMVLSLSACGEKTTSNASKEIELTWENLSDYLRIEYSFSPSKTSPKYGYKTKDVTIKVFPIAEASFNHVEIIPMITLKKGGGSINNWQVIESDPAFKYIKDLDDDYKGFLITKIALPVDGYYTETHTITQMAIMSDNLPDDGVYEFSEITSTVSRLWASDVLPEGTPCITGTVSVS